jgi:hypothetical protein
MNRALVQKKICSRFTLKENILGLALKGLSQLWDSHSIEPSQPVAGERKKHESKE